MPNKDHDWAPGDPVRAWWTDAVQDLIAGGVFNFQLVKQSNTVVRVPATTARPVGVVVDGPFRWRTTNLDINHPAGGAGFYDIYITAPTANSVTTASGVETDTTSRAFSGIIRTAGSPPTGVATYVLVGQTVWDGSAIVGIVPAVPGAFLLGTGAGQALPGDHTSVTNTRTPSDGTVTRAKVGDASLLPFRGDLKFSARPTDHGDWLVADGRTLSRTTYATLYADLGGGSSPYGQGNGTTTFNVPDLRGSTAVGADNPGTSIGDAGRLSANETRGARGGEEKHTLTTGEIPAHSHDVNAPYTTGAGGTTTGSGIPPHNAIPSAGRFDIQSQETGGGSAHNNMPPYLVGQWFVYAPVG